MQTVNIYEAKTKLSKLVDLASSGTDVVIARNGKPVARLTALENAQEKKSRRMMGFGALEGKGWIADDFDAPLPPEVQALFERSLSEKLASPHASRVASQDASKESPSPMQADDEPTGSESRSGE